MKPGLGQPERGREGWKRGRVVGGGNEWPEERLKIDSRTEQTEGSDSEKASDTEIKHTAQFPIRFVLRRSPALLSGFRLAASLQLG